VNPALSRFGRLIALEIHRVWYVYLRKPVPRL